MSGKTSRKFYKYTLQAHGHAGDYLEIFSSLRRLSREKRLAEVGYKKIFISDLSKSEKGIVIRFLSIQQDTDFMTFNEADFSTSEEALPKGKKFAVASHGFYEIGTRNFIFEYVRSGPKADEGVEAIQQIIRNNLKNMSEFRIEVAPKIDQSFLDDVDNLERIRMVSLDVTEPNTNWADWDEPLHELADESEAGRVTLQATAPRGGGLSKGRGIVRMLRQAMAARHPHLKRAIVEGNVSEGSPSITLNSSKSHEFENKRVSVDSGGSADILSISAAFDAIAREGGR